ncbi:hypothetical protein J2785_003374 [Burkholderia ambifaria]|nr:hypothetical protein [Burkholderia ambifaria]
MALACAAAIVSANSQPLRLTTNGLIAFPHRLFEFDQLPFST